MVTVLDTIANAPRLRHPEKAHKPDQDVLRKPDWIRVKAPMSKGYAETRDIVKSHRLVTVCEEAGCPNIGECWEKKHATFMIMGEICTRACAFCNVATGIPTALDPDEPARIAHAVKRSRSPRRQADAAGASSLPRRARRAGRAGLRLTNRLAEEWYRQLIAHAYVARGWIVVFDRHFLADYHASDVAGAGRSFGRRVHGWMLMHAYPRPALLILLDAPPEVLHARKGEGTLASLARRRADYLGLADAVVPATQPLPAVVTDVAALIRDAARGR